MALSSGDDDGDVDAEAVAVDWDLTERPSDGWENALTSGYSMMFDTEDDKCEEQWKLQNDTHSIEKHRDKKKSQYLMPREVHWPEVEWWDETKRPG